MPTSADVLVNLTAIANGALALAALWHAVVYGSMIALAMGWRPSTRASAMMLLGLPASVSVVSFAFGNPFNGATFALLVALLSRVARKLGRERVARGTSRATALGSIVVAYGLVYPHFLEEAPLVLYTVAAPIGLIPCPTLAVMTGVTLVAKDAFSRSWATTLAAFVLFYASFGIIRLGVFLDAGLLMSGLALALLVLVPATPEKPRVPINPIRDHDHAEAR